MREKCGVWYLSETHILQVCQFVSGFVSLSFPNKMPQGKTQASCDQLSPLYSFDLRMSLLPLGFLTVSFECRGGRVNADRMDRRGGYTQYSKYLFTSSALYLIVSQDDTAFKVNTLKSSSRYCSSHIMPRHFKKLFLFAIAVLKS